MLRQPCFLRPSEEYVARLVEIGRLSASVDVSDHLVSVEDLAAYGDGRSARPLAVNAIAGVDASLGIDYL